MQPQVEWAPFLRYFFFNPLPLGHYASQYTVIVGSLPVPTIFALLVCATTSTFFVASTRALALVLAPTPTWTRKEKVPHADVDSLHFSSLIGAYHHYFEIYSSKKQQVTQLILNAVWKLVWKEVLYEFSSKTTFWKFHETCQTVPQSMFDQRLQSTRESDLSLDYGSSAKPQISRCKKRTSNCVTDNSKSDSYFAKWKRAIAKSKKVVRKTVVDHPRWHN